MDYYERIGYLNSSYKAFYISDAPNKEIDLHYHDFHKILILLQGNINYFIEGKSYPLCPNDVVFVEAGKIHRPIVENNQPYERLILYLSKDYVKSKDNNNHYISHCFEKNLFEVIRLQQNPSEFLFHLVPQLRDEISTQSVNDIYQDALITSLLVNLCRVIENKSDLTPPSSTSNQTVMNILQYINENLTNELDINTIANAFNFNRSYLMHLFKAETGNTINHYITSKRIFLAHSMIQNSNMSLTEICYSSGFKSYSSFYRAYLEKYQKSPMRRKG